MLVPGQNYSQRLEKKFTISVLNKLSNKIEENIDDIPHANTLHAIRPFRLAIFTIIITMGPI